MSNDVAKQAMKEEVEISMTPMIDVVFLLLIFFMCTLKMIAAEGQFSTFLPKDVGTAKAKAQPELDKLKIRIIMQGAHVPGVRDWEFRTPGWSSKDVNALQKQVARFVTRSPDAPVEISPHSKAPYDAVIEVLNACVAANADTINFSMLPPAAPKQ